MVSHWEILLVVAVIILLFGAKRIPEVARGLGRAVHEFKKAKDDLARETNELVANAEKNAAAEDKPKETDEKAGKPDAG